MRTILITGGAGFIGINSARYFASRGWKVVILDNLSRAGTDDNLRWLQQSQVQFEFHKADIREASALERIVAEVKPEALLHLAAQVAVTTSVTNPREDFDINALGTFNVLEAVRLHSPKTFVLTASTNKVYGKMEEIAVTERNGRYEYRDLPQGVDEHQQLDFHSPYGCSKGVADQYTLDYARIYGLDTAAFRQSCVYGTRQFGIEDQGWVAWFAIAAVLGKQISIYGDGKQIRDVLHVEDIARAYEAAIENRAKVRGQAFNIGGGAGNTLSLLELLDLLRKELGKPIDPIFADWRPGDQPVFVCNLAKANDLLSWQPQLSVTQGVRQLIGWVRDNEPLFGWLR